MKLCKNSIARPSAISAGKNGFIDRRLARLFFSCVFLLLLALSFNVTPLRADDSYFTDSPSSKSIQAVSTKNSTSSTAASTNVPAINLINSMDGLDDKYKLIVGDRLSFRVVEDEDDPITLEVTDSGEIEAPYVGRFPAEGKTCKQLAEELKAALEKKYYYQATVIIAVNSMATRGIVYLEGAVGRPGPQEIPREEPLTVGKAILRAGGFTGFADEKHVRVIRANKGGSGENEAFVVDVSQIFEKGKTENDQRLEPGDFIIIPERMIRF